MAQLTISNYLGMLQENPDDDAAVQGLLDIVTSNDTGRLGEEPIRLLEAARRGHEQRGDVNVAAKLIELEIPLVNGDPDFEAALWKELGRMRHEELLDDAGARTAYKRALDLRPGDSEVQEAIETIDLSAEKWKEIAQRFVEEAESASDATLKTSLLVRAASLIWQYKKRGRETQVDKLFKEALKTDPSNTRAALLYEQTLKPRERWEEIAETLLDAATATRNRDEKVNLFSRAARVFNKKLGLKDRAAACYQGVLDFQPGQPEALSYLVEYYSDQEAWDHLVALYEDALRARQRFDTEQGILFQIAMTHWRRRNDAASAEPYFARLRKIDPAHAAVLTFYREYYKQTGEESRLVTVLGDAQRTAGDSGEKLRLAVELARTAMGNPATMERAIDAWKGVQRLDPDNAEAHAALKDLYTRAEKWNALVEILKAEMDALPRDAVTARVTLLREMVPIYRDRLGLDVMVINTYNAILQVSPNDAEALAALASTYEQMGRWNDLIQVLAREADSEANPARKVELYMRVAQLWIERFANYNQATRPLEQVVAIEPSNREALSKLKEIYGKKRAWTQLYDVLRKEADLASDPKARLDHLVELAKLAGDRLHRHADAIAAWREIVEEDPTTPGALDALEKLAEREKDWPTHASALERRLSQTDQPAEKIKILQKLGAIYADQLKDNERATGAWQRVLSLDPKNGRALRTLRESFLTTSDWGSLEALYGSIDDWEGLVEVLGSAADRASDTDSKVRLSFRAAEIYEKEIGEPQRAFRCYERVLSVDPRNVRAARALLPIYEKEEKWPKLVALLEVILGAVPQKDTAERLALLARLRDVALERLRDPAAALRFAAEAYRIAPTDPHVRQGLEAAAEKAGAFDVLVDCYMARIQDAPPHEALGLRRRVAVVAGERLGKATTAVAQLKQILDGDPTDQEAIGSLDRIYRMEGRNDDLGDLYAHRIEHARDNAQRVELLGELAKHEEDTLGDAASAAERYRAILAIDPDHREALSALDRLALSGKNWKQLVGILRQRRELAQTDAERAEITMRLGRRLADELGDTRGALDAFAEVLGVEPTRADAVTALEKLEDQVGDPEMVLEIGRLLERSYEAMGVHEKLARVLRKRLDTTTDKAEKRALRLRLAELKGSKLGDAAGAYASLEAAFLDRPEDVDLWDRLARAAEESGKHEALALAYATAIEAGDLDASLVADLSGRVAALYDTVLARPEQAESFHKRVIEHDPLNEESFLALKELYMNQERWGDLQVLYRNRIAETSDANVKLDLLRQVGFLFEELLDEPDLAIKAHREVVELDPEDIQSRRALERLFVRTEAWRDLAGLLESELGLATGPDVIDLMFRLGELNETKLATPSAAVEHYSNVLRDQPTHLRAQNALERLLTEPTERQRIATILEPIYERQGAWTELARVLEVQLDDVREPGSRVALLIRIASLYEDKLHDPAAAFRAYARAVESDPADPRPREELSRLARTRDSERERAEVLEKAISASGGSVSLESELLFELATLWDERVGDADRAERAYERLIAVDGTNPTVVLPASQALERIHLGKGDHTKLAEDLRRQVEFETDPDVRRRLLVRLGELLETTLEDVDGAIAIHRQRLDADPTDVDAMRALERLLERQAQWQPLIEVLRTRDRVSETEDQRRDIARRIGRIYEEKLSDRESAIAAYNEIVTGFGHDRDTLASLARLYEAEQKWQDLLDVLTMDHDLVDNPHERAEIRFRSAELMRLRTGELERAIDAYAEVLETAPEHEDATHALEEIVRGSDARARVAAARVLVPRYETRGWYDKLIGVLEVLAESDDPTERLKSLRRAAEVADIGAGVPARAFDFMARAIKAGLSEDDLGEMLRELERLAASSSRWDDYVRALREVGPDILDGELQTETYAKIADVARTRLNDGALAKEYYAKVLEQRPEDMNALDALEELTASANDHRGLIDVLKRKIELASSPDARLDMLLRQADIAERALDDTALAIDSYEQVLEAADRSEAYEGLERLYDKAERWPDLAALYERQVERSVGHGVELHYKLGRIHHRRLGDAHQGLEHYREALQRDPTHEATIGALESMVRDSNEHRAVAAEILEPVFLQRMDWPKVTAALEARLGEEADLDQRKKLLERLGQIHEDHLEDLEGAMETYARLFREDPVDERVWETLQRLARVLERWDRLAEIYGGALDEISIDDPGTARLAYMSGQIHAARTGNLDKAAEYYRRALRFEPTDRKAFEAVEAVYVKQNAHEKLLELYRDQADIAQSDAERVALLHKVAHLHEESLADADRAIDVYTQVLDIDGGDQVAIEALDRLLVQRERWSDLGDLLRRRIDLAGGNVAKEVELKHRLGEVLATKLDDRAGAIDVYEEIVQSQPDHRPTIAALEVLVQDAEHQLRIIHVLEPLYRRADQWKKLIAIYEAQVQLGDDPIEKVRLLGEIAQLHETRGKKLDLAFHARARAFAEEPTNEEVRAELERLATQLNAWDGLVAAYEQGIANCTDPVTASSILSTMARVHDEKRGDPRSAIETYERLLGQDENDASALDALEGLHTMVGDWRGLVDVLSRKVERAYDPGEQGELLRRMGSVLEELLADKRGAVDAYRRAAELDDNDAVALEALDRLYTATSDWDSLFPVLRRRVELAQDPAERVEVGLRMGALADDQLKRPEDAIEAYQRVIDDEPSHPTAVAALARLFEKQGMWADLLDNLKLQAGMTESSAERVAFLHRAGEVLERELDDVPEALKMYSSALELDAHHEPAITALMRIANIEDYRVQAAEQLEPLLRNQSRWDELAQLLEQAAELTGDPIEKRNELRRLAEIHEQGRRDQDAAFEAYRRALREDPNDEQTANDLERLAAALGAWERLADTFAARASSALDPNVGRGLYMRVARLAEQNLKDDDRAIEAFSRAAEMMGDDDETLGALDRLYTKTEQWNALGEVIERRIAVAPDPSQIADLLMRLGALREERFDDRRGAFQAYRDVLDRDPSEPRALAAIEGLVEDPDLASEVVDVLDGAYRQAGSMEKVASLFQTRIKLADTDGERVRLLQDLAAIQERDLGDAPAALDTMRRAFESDPRDEVLLGELERLAPMAGSWEPLRGLVEKVTAAGGVDRALRRDLNLRAARWYRDHLADAAAAETCLRAAIEAELDTPEAHEQLVDLIRSAGGREADLVEALRAWAEVDSDEYARKDRLREAARLAESALSDTATAAECFDAILRIDPNDAEAMDDLSRIRTAEGKWDEVVDLLGRRVDIEPDPHKRIALRRQIAELYTGPLGDEDRAISSYQAILDEEPSDSASMTSLERIFEKAERWTELQQIIERRLDLAETPAERIAARVRIARLNEQRFGRRSEAIEQLQEILHEDGRNAEALDELERLYGADERWSDLVDLLERRAGDAAGAGADAEELATLGRLAAIYETRLADPTKALSTYERVLERDARAIGPLTALVRLYSKQNDFESAGGALERLVDAQDGASAVRAAYDLADLAENKLQDVERAGAALRKAYELDPSSAESRSKLRAHYEKHNDNERLAELLALEAEEATETPAKVALLKRIAEIYAGPLNNPDAAASHLERAAELVPEDRTVLLPLCDFYIAAGRQRDAIPVLEKIIASYGGRRTKEVAQFHHRLGKALEGMGDTAGALAQYDAAFKVDLTNVHVLRDLGRLCHHQGDLDRAQKTFRALLLQKLDANSGITKADVYFFLGDISAKQGDKSKAISMLERAVAEQRDHSQANALLASLRN